MKTFFFILNTRIRLSMIKKYKTNGEKSITVYYGLASKNPSFEVFTFEDTEERDAILEELDNILL